MTGSPTCRPLRSRKDNRLPREKQAAGPRCSPADSCENDRSDPHPSTGTTPMNSLVDSDDPALYDIRTHGPGPEGRLPLTAEQLRAAPSGDIFGLTQDVGM